MAGVAACRKVAGSGSDKPLLQGPSVLRERGVHSTFEIDVVYIDDYAVASSSRHARYVTYIT